MPSRGIYDVLVEVSQAMEIALICKANVVICEKLKINMLYSNSMTLAHSVLKFNDTNIFQCGHLERCSLLGIIISD